MRRRITIYTVIISFLLLVMSGTSCQIIGGSATPKAGDWTTSTDFGGIDFTVNSNGTNVIRLTCTFTGYTCGDSLLSGSLVIEKEGPWWIDDSIFAVEAMDSERDCTIKIRGKFDATGERCTGTWVIIDDATDQCCSGTWTSLHY